MAVVVSSFEDPTASQAARGRGRGRGRGKGFGTRKQASASSSRGRGRGSRGKRALAARWMPQTQRRRPQRRRRPWTRTEGLHAALGRAKNQA
eukprot:1157106-Pelagomonas_calceolata.AAC.1